MSLQIVVDMLRNLEEPKFMRLTFFFFFFKRFSVFFFAVFSNLIKRSSFKLSLVFSGAFCKRSGAFEFMIWCMREVLGFNPPR